MNMFTDFSQLMDGLVDNINNSVNTMYRSNSQYNVALTTKLHGFKKDKSMLYPSVKTVTKPDYYQITLTVPGFSPEEISISITDDKLQVTGKQEKTEDKIENSFVDTWLVPTDVMADHVEATYKAGMLTLTLPRQRVSPKESKTIPIKVMSQ